MGPLSSFRNVSHYCTLCIYLKHWFLRVYIPNPPSPPTLVTVMCTGPVCPVFDKTCLLVKKKRRRRRRKKKRQMKKANWIIVIFENFYKKSIEESWVFTQSVSILLLCYTFFFPKFFARRCVCRVSAALTASCRNKENQTMFEDVCNKLLISKKKRKKEKQTTVQVTKIVHWTFAVSVIVILCQMGWVSPWKVFCRINIAVQCR